MKDSCEVSLNDPECLGYWEVRCFSCGDKVCRRCSQIVPRYFKWRRVRLCNDCIEDRKDDEGAYTQYPAGDRRRRDR